MKDLAKASAREREQPRYTFEHRGLNKTVVVMPFLGSDMGAGHSNLGNRFVYLQACFWSLYARFPYVTVAVKGVKDYDWVRNTSGLPFWDVLLLEGLPKSASLPVATVQATKSASKMGDGATLTTCTSRNRTRYSS